jgi:hypothetical protein
VRCEARVFGRVSSNRRKTRLGIGLTVPLLKLKEYHGIVKSKYTKRKEYPVPAKKNVYIESTIPSYATAQSSSNVMNMIRKMQTLAFWNKQDMYKFWISQDVLDEIRRGNPEAAQRRLDFVKNIAILPKPEGLDQLSSQYQALFKIPERAKIDCSHLACCVLSKIDYLLTWNCTHLGPIVQDKMRVYNDRNGLWTPILVTPEILYGLKEEKQ